MQPKSLPSPKPPKQTEFQKPHWKHRYCHGGELRKSRQGRSARPLSTKLPLHLVFKMKKGACGGLRKPQTHTLCHRTIRQYAKRFVIKIEQVSVQPDHIHLLIRTTKRSLAQHFFRVTAGQIAQRVTGTLNTPKQQDFWKHRPFTRIIKGYKTHKTVIAYIKLNEKEALGVIPYRKERLKNLSPEELKELWQT